MKTPHHQCRTGCPGYHVTEARALARCRECRRFIHDDEAAVAFVQDLARRTVHALAAAHQLTDGLLIIDTPRRARLVLVSDSDGPC
jgi:hypothetical protein